jgi:hypothetical protein
MISQEIFETPSPQNVWNKIKIGMGFFTGRTSHIEINGNFACIILLLSRLLTLRSFD